MSRTRFDGGISLETFTFPVGTILYRGARDMTWLEPQHFRSPVWIAQTRRTAAFYTGVFPGSSNVGYVGKYATTKPLTLIMINRENVLKLLHLAQSFAGAEQDYFDRAKRIQRMMSLLPSRDVDQHTLYELLQRYLNPAYSNLRSRWNLDREYAAFVRRKRSLPNRKEELQFIKDIEYREQHPEYYGNEYYLDEVFQPQQTIYQTLSSVFKLHDDGTVSRDSWGATDAKIVKWLCSTLDIQGWVAPEFRDKQGNLKLREEIMLCGASRDSFQLLSVTRYDKDNIPRE